MEEPSIDLAGLTASAEASPNAVSPNSLVRALRCPSPGCEHQAKQRTLLGQHMRTVHGLSIRNFVDDADLQCPHCSFKGSKIGGVHRHMRESHGDDSARLTKRYGPPSKQKRGKGKQGGKFDFSTKEGRSAYQRDLYKRKRNGEFTGRVTGRGKGAGKPNRLAKAQAAAERALVKARSVLHGEVLVPSSNGHGRNGNGKHLTAAAVPHVNQEQVIHVPVSIRALGSLVELAIKFSTSAQGVNAQ